MALLLVFLLLPLFLLSVYALPSVTVGSRNVTLVNVNSSDYWDNLNTPDDITSMVNFYTRTQTQGLFLNLTGTNAVQNIRLGQTTLFNFTVDSLAGNLKWSNLTDFPSYCAAGQFVNGVNKTLSCATPTTFNSTYDLYAYNQTLGTGNVSGDGTAGYITQWQTATKINNSLIYQNDSRIGILTTNPETTFNVIGNVTINGSSVRINNAGYYGALNIKGSDSANNYSVAVLNPSGTFAWTLKNFGRVDAVSYSTDGAVYKLTLHPTTPANGQRAGHYAFGAYSNNSGEHTISLIQSTITNVSSENLSSTISLAYMDDVDGSPAGVEAVQQPNEQVDINASGITLPGTQLLSTASALKLQNNVLITSNQQITNGTFVVKNSSDWPSLFVTGVGNIGIGTQSPLRPIDLNSSTPTAFMHMRSNNSGETTNDGFDFGMEAGDGAIIWQREQSYIRFATNNTERMRLDVFGRLGLNGSSTGRLLDVYGTVRTRAFLEIINSPDDGTNPIFSVLGTGGTISLFRLFGNSTVNSNFVMRDLSNVNQVIVHTNGTSCFACGGAMNASKFVIGSTVTNNFFETKGNSTLNNTLFVLNNGNVGVGVSAPTQKFEVAGNIMPNANITYDLGNATRRWANFWTQNATIVNLTTGDLNWANGFKTIEPDSNSVCMYNATGGQVGCFTNTGIKVPILNSNPTCDFSSRGNRYILNGGLGVADIEYVCVKTALDTYVLKAVTLV